MNKWKAPENKKKCLEIYLGTCQPLFIWHLFVCSDEKEEEEYEKEEVGEDGEIILVSGDKVSGPWNKSGAAPPPAAPVGEYIIFHFLFITYFYHLSQNQNNTSFHLKMPFLLQQRKKRCLRRSLLVYIALQGLGWPPPNEPPTRALLRSIVTHSSPLYWPPPSMLRHASKSSLSKKCLGAWCFITVSLNVTHVCVSGTEKWRRPSRL